MDWRFKRQLKEGLVFVTVLQNSVVKVETIRLQNVYLTRVYKYIVVLFESELLRVGII